MVREADFSPRRLSGLLSGCPPTSTRPQARAKLGEARNKESRCHNQALSALTANFFRKGNVNESAGARLLARREGLDAHAVAHECDHDRNPEDDEHDLQN